MADHSNGETDLPEPHRVVRVGRFDDPVSVINDTEAWRARDLYPEIVARGPLFAIAEQEVDGRWRIVRIDEGHPQASRDSLACECRRRAQAAGEAGDPAGREAWMAGAATMEWEKVNELTVRDRRFRIARGDMFMRIGLDGPEPPRPGDPDPMPIGKSHQQRSRAEGFLLDPAAATGMSEGILKLDLLSFVYARVSVPPDVHADSVRAQYTHPGGVLLPPAFTVAERAARSGSWGAQQNLAQECPQGARDYLMHRFEAVLPLSHRPPERERSRFPELPAPIRDELARQHELVGPGERTLGEDRLRECSAALARLRAERLDDIVVLGRHYRIVRLERLIRLGPDGPEAPRPSDWDPHLPAEAEYARDQVAGITSTQGAAEASTEDQPEQH